MKKKYPSLTKQLKILGFQFATLGFCTQPAICAGPVYIPGYYGSAASILPQPAANVLPSGGSVVTGINPDSLIPTSTGKMNILQTAPRAVIRWQNFDIGSQGSVNFDQQDSSWKVLNQVTGDGYSQIFGSLTAKGQVYILNQNGIFFGTGSQVNVHSLTASALNLNENDFLNLPSFSQGGKETYTYSSSYPLNATVSNHGTITAGDLGSVFLIGPQVENDGTITARSGRVGLLAGDRVEISQDAFAVFQFNVENSDTSGTATNFEDGQIITENGLSVMQGSFVNQNGLIRAVTALENNGRIVLKAKNKVTTGAASLTETPVSDSGERKVVDVDTFKNSAIDISADSGTIEHYGRISAPGGDVTLTAKDRVFLAEGSSIDVGGSWVQLAASDRIVDVQLNSQELRDAFVYKSGPLKGQTVQVDVLEGLPLADISGYLNSMAKSAPELTTKGGTIRLTASGDNGEVVVKQGASLDFSGGGLLYGAGLIQSTKVRVGNNIYDLQDVPTGVPIDEVLGSYTKEYNRYGVTESWQGLYYGGSTSYQGYLPSFVQGADGGVLDIISRKVVLDGTMNASVVRGVYQNALTDPTDANGNLASVGRAVPKAGTLQIGMSPGLTDAVDLTTDAIVVKNEVTPATISAGGFLADHDDAIRLSELSATEVNEAGIGTLKLYANTTIKIDDNVNLTLADLGAVDFAAQNIENRGSIRIPSGTVNFTLKAIEGSGTAIPSVLNRIFLADDSSIDVSGKRLDNSAADFNSPLKFGFTTGGTVKLIDDNAASDGEVLLAENSTINVNGGYVINRDNSITGGKAGTVTIKGNTVQPGGHITGLALEGSEGGTLSIHTDEVTIAQTAPSLPNGFEAYDELPENMRHHLDLADNRFVNSGFSHIELKSEGDLLVEKGASIAPSATRIAQPTIKATGYQLDEIRTVSALPENFGSNSLALAAGQKIYTDRAGTVTVEESASLSAAPGQGTISLLGNEITLAGTLQAFGGNISVKATNGDVVLASGAIIDVSGTTLSDPKSSIPHLALNSSVVNGGSVVLSAVGDVVLEQGSLIDVSGSEAVTNRAIDNNGQIVETTIASSAGSVSIDFQNTFTSDGILRGNSQLSWLTGGSLTVAKTGNNAFTLQENNFADWQKNGFDNFIFSSRREINFVESALDNDEIISIEATRGLTLNGSAIVGSGSQQVNISAPWLQLSNMVLGTTRDIVGERIFNTVDKGSARLALSGDFIDIQGNIALSGFAETSIKSSNDLRLYDYYYSSPSLMWSGALRTAGNLTLQAAAIYPGMHHTTDTLTNTHTVYPSSFTITAGLTDGGGNIKQGEGGKITILAAEDSVQRDIYSAGGRLTLIAGDIENYGVLAAPMGEIVLLAENRIDLFPGSLLSTRGEATTLYGKLDTQQWTVGGYMDNTTEYPLIPVTAAPDKSVQITAKTITQASEATIDVGGGGAIFAYEFLPGYDGSVNPLGKTNRYVILPDNSVVLPGKTIYLEGVDGLASGTYSLLPVEYAFLPGAIVIEDTGKNLLSGQQYITPAGYTVTAGYMSDRSIAAASPLRSGYIVRSASDVLAEGKFDTQQIVAGDAGLVEVNAGSGSSKLAGTILSNALAGYSGGVLKLSAEDLLVGPSTALEEVQENYNLVFDIDKIKKKGVRLLQLGNADTNTVTLAAGSTLEDVPQVEMNAKDSIILQRGVQVYAPGDASGQQGTITLTSNTLYGEKNTLLHASDALNLNINNLSASTFAGDIHVDHGTFQVNSGMLYIEPSSYTGVRTSEGFYIPSSMVEAFKSIDNVILTSRSDISFLGSVNLDAKGDLTLDSARFTVGSSPISPYTVNINAGGTLRVQNNSAVSTGNDSVNNSNAINLAAATISFGPGAVNFDNFNGVHFSSTSDTLFSGTGSLTADLAAGGTLSFSASRYLSAMTEKSSVDANGKEYVSFGLSDFTIDSGSGNVAMTGNGLGNSTTIAMPGSLTVKGTNINLKDAVFNMPGGSIDFQASQNIIAENSSILAIGGDLNFPVTIGNKTYDNVISLNGGQVTLQSGQGTISIDRSTIIDTSAKAGKDGGSIILSAPENGVVLEGTIQGDSVTIDTNSIDDFGALSRTIAAGGFEKQVDLRARNNNVTIGYADTLQTDRFILSADQGSIDIFGTIDVSGQDKGGTAEISALNNLTLQTTGRILAKGEGANAAGGSVFLASGNGAVQTFGLDPVDGTGGALIDVSGNGSGGEVTFRASRDVIKSGAMLLGGEIRGASEASVHAFRVYNNTTNVTSSSVTQYKNDINNEWTALQAAWKYPAIAIIPEVEVRSSGNMTIASGLETLETLRTAMPNGIPGVFTFRAAGDLNVTSNIIDAPLSSRRFNQLYNKYEYVPVSDGIRDSWDLSFVAGADLTSTRLLNVHNGSGNFNLGTQGNGKLIYTESGDINVDAGNNITIYALSTSAAAVNYMPGTDRYNLASFDGAISGYAGGSLLLNGGVIQTAVSDIALQVRNNVQLNPYTSGSKTYYSAIRTTGRAPLVTEIQAFDQLINDPNYNSSNLSDYAQERFWEYRDGGNITLAAGGNISGSTATLADGSGWDYAYNDKKIANYLGLTLLEEYSASYGMQANGWYNGSKAGQVATHGIATMAGGSIDISAEDFYSQVGTFGDGDLTIYARGNLDGRFLSNNGDMHLTSLANFGNTADNMARKDTLVELGAGHLAIQALGNVSLGTICNPAFSTLKNTWMLTYDEQSSVAINAALGDAIFSGNQNFVSNDNYFHYYLLPSILSVTAGQDIRFSMKKSNPFILAPSSEGQLSLVAGRDIDGKKSSGYDASYSNSQIFMSAADPTTVYGYQKADSMSQQDTNLLNLLEYGNTVPTPLHTNNVTPVVVEAGRDIANMTFDIPKHAEIYAERDIDELGYWGQNLGEDEVSLVSAGRNLIQQPYEGTNLSFGDLGIYQAGHGFLVVRAGGDIDLGSTAGIQSTGSDIGNGYINNALFKDSDRDSYNRYKGADVAVIAGYTLEKSDAELASFFNALTEYGKEYSILMATGKQEDKNEAARLKNEILATLINPLLDGSKSGSGNIAMTQSTIKTTSGQDDLYILAAGQVDVGTSIISKEKDTSKGLLTEGGGSINVFAENDINVNESRVVTYFGGDILLLSNHGNINAGRGSKTAVSPMAEGYIDVGGTLVNKFSAPAPGSGIRTLTADPDGAGPITTPEQGKISLIAWEGVIDAGEAGISASNLILAATQILNSNNINFSNSGVGVPVTAEAGPSLGALAGASTVSGSQTASQAMGQQAIESDKMLAASMNKVSEGLNIKTLVFKLEGFSDDLTPEQINSDSRGSVDENI